MNATLALPVLTLPPWRALSWGVRFGEADERELVRGCVEGRRDAWDAFLKRYWPKIRQMVTWNRWGVANSHFEDMAQEVFMRLFDSLRYFDFRSRLDTFVLAVVLNTCSSYARHERLRTAHDGGSKNIERTELFEPLADLQFDELREDLKNDVLRCVGRLNPFYRQVVELRFYGQLSYEEISKELDIPTGTVSSTLYRALIELRSLLKDYQGREEGQPVPPGPPEQPEAAMRESPPPNKEEKP